MFGGNWQSTNVTIEFFLLKKLNIIIILYINIYFFFSTKSCKEKEYDIKFIITN